MSFIRVVPVPLSFDLTCNVDSPEKQNDFGNGVTDGALVIADGGTLGTLLLKAGGIESDGTPVVDGCIPGALLTEGARMDGATAVDDVEDGGNISPIIAVAKSWLALIITSARPK
jgi:hypothetical protein